MTFAKKMLSCGVYYTTDKKMATPFRHFNTFFGDPVRAILSAEVNKCVEEDNLAELAIETGAYMKTHLDDLAVKYPKYIQNVRGKAMYMAFDSETAEDRDKLMG